MEQNSKFQLPTNKCLKSTQIFIVASTILLALIITVVCIGLLMRYEVNSDVSSVKDVPYWNDKLAAEQVAWYKRGLDELWDAISLRTNSMRAENLIIFMASGLNPEVLAAARLDNLNNVTSMSWDKFPYLGMLRHSCPNSDVCNLLSLATALFGGVKTNSRLGGLDSSVPLRNCAAALNRTHQIESILEMAQKAGKRTGFVTTGRVTAARMAALYAKVSDSNWECDQYMPLGKINEGCSDIARELVENSTGHNINVIMGGGRQTLVSNVPATKSDPIDIKACNSNDKRNLIRDWRKRKLLEKKAYSVLHNAEDLNTFDGSKTDYVLGVFSNGNMQHSSNTPSLGDMVNKSISVLKRKKQGYILIVNEEVDPTTSRSLQTKILRKFNEVIENMLEMVKRNDERTLFIILFDSAVTPPYTDITSAEEENTFDTNDHVQGEEVPSRILQNLKPDTLVFAKGPQGYLLQGMHDETYLAHAVSFSMKIGHYYQKTS